MEFERDTIINYETAAEVTLCQEETLESIVPDACPDILRIVDVCGQATVSGKHELRALAIDPEAVDPEDVEMLQDMIVAAVNEAMRAADADAANTMQSLTGGLNLGGLGL